MTDTKYNKLVTTILCVTIPLMIGLLAWLVRASYKADKDIAVVVTEGQQREILQAKIWELIQVNNEILEGKADGKINESEHSLIIAKIDFIQQQLNLVRIRTELSVVPILDTVKTTLVVVSMKTDTITAQIKNLENAVLLGIVPYKESSIVSTEMDMADKYK